MGISTASQGSLHGGQSVIWSIRYYLGYKMFSSEVATVISALSRIGKQNKPSFFSNKYEKCFLYTMLLILASIIVLGVCYYCFKITWLKVFLLILTLFFYLIAIAWQLLLVTPILKFFKDPTGNFLTDLELSVSREISSMTSLASVSNNSIQYVHDRLVLVNSQLNTRMAFLLGAVEKVGVLPGVIASLFALSKMSEKKPLIMNGEDVYFYIALVLLVLYVFSLVFLMVGQKFEIYIGVLKHYLQYRSDKVPTKGLKDPESV